MPEAALNILNVVCTYGTTPVLNGITLDINKGDFTGIIGPNGSGKSTLLKTMSRVLQPLKGKVTLLGKDVFSMSSRETARKLAVVSQETRVDFDFTVEEIVLMGRLPHLKRFESEGPKDMALARKAMEQTRTLHLANRLVTELSGGEKQRVLIARALTQEPEVLLLDEPTSHLDINHQTEVLDLLKRLSGEDRLTVIIVLHDLNLAAQYCDTLLLLSGGRIFSLGSPQEVITSSNIKAVYNTDVLVTEHPVYNRPMVTPLSKLEKTTGQEKKNFSVHVVGGGGAASPLFRELVSRGYHVTAGVLNISDSDWEAAKSQGIRTVEDPPFSPLTEESCRKNLEFMRKADIIVLANIPFGYGNLKNLESVLQVSREGSNVIVIENEEISKRDYTKGRAAEIYATLLNGCGSTGGTDDSGSPGGGSGGRDGRCGTGIGSGGNDNGSGVSTTSSSSGQEIFSGSKNSKCSYSGGSEISGLEGSSRSDSGSSGCSSYGDCERSGSGGSTRLVHSIGEALEILEETLDKRETGK